jgi:hypothetical protein
VPRELEPLVAVTGRLVDLGVRGKTTHDARAVRVHIGQALGRVLSTAEPETAVAVRRRIEAENGWEILFGEWVEICDRAADPLVAFEIYQRSILHRLPVYAEQYTHWIATSVLRRLPEERRAAASLGWLRDRLVDRFPPELAQECVTLANAAVSLDLGAPNGEEATRLVSEEAARLGIRLRPDRPLLRCLLKTARTPHTTLRDLRLDVLREAAPALAADDYALLLDTFLEPALERVSAGKEHEQVLLAACGGQHLNALEQRYLAFFTAKRKSPWPESLHAALRFWLSFDRGGSEETRCLAALEETAREGLVTALARLGPKQLEGIGQKLRKARIGDRATARWEQIQTALEKRKRSPWARLARVFVRP